MIVLKHGIVGRTLSVLLAVSLGLFLWPSYPTTANAVQLETLASGYDIDINSPDTFGWIPAEPHIDPPGDASGGATTKDIVGDAEHPSVFLQYSPDGTQLAIRMRVDAKDGGTEENPQFKNFMYFALDVNGSAAIDFMLGAYRPTEANGRLAIYLADPSKPNTGPGNTGATSPIASFQPIRGTNYSFIQAAYDPGDPLYPGFNGTPDYFITLVFSLEDIDNALAAVNKQNLQITPHSPFSYVIGTATQENSMNGDINGLVGVNSNDPWDFPAAISTDGEDYYTVHFNKNGGDRDASPLYASVKEGDRLRTPPTPPRKIGGWEFVGWSYDPNDDPENLQHEFLFEREAITGHLTIYAIWLARSTEEQLEEDTLHFDASGGNWVTAAKFQHRETEDGVIKDMPPTPLAPTTPAVQGGNSMRTFGGWVTSSTYGTNGNNILPISGNTNAGEIEFYIWSEVVKSLNKVYQSTCGEEEYTVYALWLDVPKSATSIHFYGNIPQPSLPTGRLLYDVYLGNNSTPSYTPTPPTRQGYDFKGWDTLPTGTGARYLNPYNTTTINNFLGAKFVDGQNLYAIWEPVRYAVVFDPNSIDTNGDKLSGRAQLEFYSALCVSNATSFLYPVFPDGPYDPNNIEPYPYGAEGPVRPNGPSLKHYAFRGWNTDPGGFGFWAYPNNSPEHTISAGGDMKFALLQQPYLPGSVVVDGKSVSGYTRLYAIWERQPVASVQINFVANPGRFVDGSATGEFGAWTTEEGKIESAEYSTPEYLDWDNPEGAYTHQYIFKGWSYLPGEPGDGRQVDFFHPLTEVFFTSCSVYAVWEEVPPDYTVTFWPNNGYWPSNEPDPYGPLTVGTDDYNLVLYVPYSNTPIHPVRPDPWPGFELLGWNTEFDGSGDVFRPSHAVTGNLNVYAQWKSLDPDVVSVLYYLNDGSGAPYSNYDYPDTMVKGSRLTAPLRALVKDEPGWTFGGWFTDENCLNQWIATTNTFDDDPTVLYAKWFVDVTFDDNYPDSLGTRVKSTQWDRTVAAPTTPMRNKNVFIGWYTDPECPADAEWDFKVNKVTEPLTLYAKWTSTEQYNAAVVVQKDGVAWSGRTIKISRNGTDFFDLYNTGVPGEYICPAYADTYQVWVDGVNTGRTLTVTSAGGTVTVNYWTLTTTVGTGISSVGSGGVYLAGTAVALSATVANTYSWARWAADPTDYGTVSAQNTTIIMPDHTLNLTATGSLTTYLARVVVYRDNLGYPGLSVQLTTDGTNFTTMNPGAAGVYTAAMLPGSTYQIWIGGEDTGRTVTVTTTGSQAALNYWTLNLLTSQGIAATSGSGTYLDGTTLTIDAALTDYYRWFEWVRTDGHTTFSTVQRHTFTISEPMALTAWADWDTQRATVSVVRNSHPWNGLAVEISADRSTFIALTESFSAPGSYESSEVSPGTYAIYLGGEDTGRTITITTGPRTEVLDYCSLTLAAGPGTETAQGSGVYLSGSKVSISASLMNGYYWDGWLADPLGYGNVVGQNTSITMPDYPLLLIAQGLFGAYAASVQINRDDSPRRGLNVKISGDNGATYTDLPESLTTPGLYKNAAIAPGSYAIYIGGENTGKTLTITTSAASAILDYYTLTLAAGTGTSAPTGGGVYLIGTSVSINAVVSSGYSWLQWIHTVGGDDYSSTQAYTVAVTSTLSLTAMAVLDTYPAAVKVNLNDDPWSGHSLTISSDGGITSLGLRETESGSGIYAISGVAPATYTIYRNSDTTGAIITVTSDGANEATLDYYTLTLGNDTGIVSVSGAGEYLAGATAVISAELDGGYGFGKWVDTRRTGYGEVEGSPTTITMPAFALELTATGLRHTYMAAVTINLDGSAGNGLSIKLSPDNNTFFALPETDAGTGIYAAAVVPGTYHIYQGGLLTGRTIEIIDSAASQTLNYYTLSLEASTGIARVVGSGIYLEGTTVSAFASVQYGWGFGEWSSDNPYFNGSKSNPLSFAMPATALAMTASATQDTHLASVEVSIDGVAWSGRTIELSADRSTFIRLPQTGPETGIYNKAVIAGVYHIYKDGVDTSRQLEITDAAVSETLSYFTLTLEPSTGITSVAGGGIYLAGAFVRATATAQSGWGFNEWTSDNPSFDGVKDNTHSFFMPAATLTMTATGTQDTHLATVTVTKDASAWRGLTLELSADRAVFISLTETASASGVYQKAVIPGTYHIYKGGMDTGRTLTITDEAAGETLNYYTLTLYTSTGITSVAGAGTYLAGATIRVSAEVLNGWGFEEWTSESPAFDGVKTNTHTFSMPAATLSVTATATQDTFAATVTVVKDGNAWGGLAITLTADRSTFIELPQTGGGTGVYRVAVIPAVYHIYKGGVDTGRTLTISDDAAGETLSYFSLILNTSTGIISTTGDGVYLAGAAVSATAIAEQGWGFNGWTSANLSFDGSKANPLSFTMPATSLTLKATALQDTYTATVVVNRNDLAWDYCTIELSLDRTTFIALSESGSTTGLYQKDIPAGVYHIYKDSVDTGHTLAITTTPATQTLNYYSLTTDRDPGISSVTGEGTYLAGDPVSVSATAQADWGFTRWTSENLSFDDRLDNPYKFIMPAATLTLKATSAQDTHPATVKVYKDGNVWGDLSIELSADHTTFVSLVESDTDTGTYQNTLVSGVYHLYKNQVDTGRTLQISAAAATGTLSYYTLTPRISNGITATTGAGVYLAGAEVTVSAAPLSGWGFTKWISDNEAFNGSNDNPYAFTMPAETLTMTATATQDTHLATVSINRDASPWAGLSIELSEDRSTFITLVETAAGSGVYQKALVAGTYHLYQEGVDTGRTLQVAAGDSTETLNYYTLTLRPSDGIVSVAGAGIYLAGTPVSVSAVADVYWGFYKWTSGNSYFDSKTANPFDFSMPAAALTLTATAIQDTHMAIVNVFKNGNTWGGLTLELSADHTTFIALPETGGGTGIYAYAVAPDTYYLYKDGIDTGRTLTITTAVAAQTLSYYSLTLNTSAGISAVTGTGEYLEGTRVTLSSSVTNGYLFNAWVNASDNGSGDIRDNPFTLTMPAAALQYNATATLITFGASVAMTRDGAAWSGVNVELSANGTNFVTLYETFSGSGIYQNAVVPGEYSIYKDGIDTGRTLTVTTGPQSETLSYYTLTLVKGAGISSLEGDGVYLSGTTITLDATVMSGYDWNRWVYSGGSDYSTSKSVIFTVTSTSSLSAEATLIAYAASVTLTVDGVPGEEFSVFITKDSGISFVPLIESETNPGTYEASEVVPGEYVIFIKGKSSGMKLDLLNGPASESLDYHTLTLAEGEGITSVSGAGIYPGGASVAISADVAEGYSWSSWSAVPVEFGNAAAQSTSITMPEYPLHLSAMATLDSFSAKVTVTLDSGFRSGLDVSISSDGGITSTKLGETGAGTGVYTVSGITPGPYAIALGGIDIGKTLIISSTGSNETTLSYYTLTLGTPAGIGSVSGAGVYFAETRVVASAEAQSGWGFDRWTSEHSDHNNRSDNPYTFTMPASALTLTPLAIQDTYRATVSVNKDNSAWTGLAVELTVDHASFVSLLETGASSGSYQEDLIAGTYHIYQGGVDTGRTLQITTSATTETLNYFTLTLEGSDGITSVTGEGVYLAGALVVASAEAQSGWGFTEWSSENSAFNVSDNPCTLTMPASVLTLTARATRDTHRATVIVNKDNSAWTGLSIELSLDHTTFITLPESGTQTGSYQKDLVAGTYHLYKEGVDTGRTLLITTDATAETLDYYTLTLATSTGITSVAGEGVYLAGIPVFTLALAQSGWGFNEWTSANSNFNNISANPYGFTMPSSALTLTATATQDKHRATVSVNKDNSAWAGLTIELVNEEGTRFTTLTESLTNPGVYEAPYVIAGVYTIFVKGENTTETLDLSSGPASKTLNYYTLTLSEGTGIGSVFGSGVYLDGTSVTIDAAALNGYRWSRWVYAGGSDYSTTKTTTFTVTAASSLRAEATFITYTASVAVTLDGVAREDLSIFLTKDSGISFVPLAESATTAGTYEALGVVPGAYAVFVQGKTTGRILDLLSGSASMQLDYYTLTLAANEGVISLSGAGVYLAGSPVVVSAELDSDYSFKSWAGTAESGFDNLEGSPATFTMPGSSLELTATTNHDTYVATVSVDLNKVSWGGLFVLISSNGRLTTTTLVETVAGSGVYTAKGVKPGQYEVFIGESGTGKSFMVSDTGTNRLALDYYTLTLKEGSGIQSISEGGIYLAGAKVGISAEVTEGYSWSEWLAAPEDFGTVANQYSTITIPDYPLELTASAQLVTFSAMVQVNRSNNPWSGLTVTISSDGGVTSKQLMETSEGTGVYSAAGFVAGPYVILIAGVDTGKTIVVSAGTNKVTLNYATLRLNASSGITSVSGAGNYLVGSVVELSAVVGAGYSWDEWVSTPEDFGNVAEQYATLIMPEFDLGLTAIATLDTYKATVNLSVDGAARTGTKVELTQDGITYTELIESLPGVYSCPDIAPGDYSISVGGENTGQSLSIASGAAETSLSYYSVVLSATPAGAATGASIASSNGISSGSLVLSGTSITFSASGSGALSYSYQWDDGSITPILMIDNIQAPLSLSCVVRGSNTPVALTATVILYLDDVAWLGKSAHLYSGDSLIATLADKGDGSYSAQAPLGTYSIYVDATNTGKSLTVSDAHPNVITFSYYSVFFSATASGTTATASISASNGMASGRAVLSETNLVFTAAGSGATSYSYLWNDGSTGRTFEIASLSAPVTLTCVVAGTGSSTTVNAKVVVNLNSSSWTGRAVELYKLGALVIAMTDKGDGSYTAEIEEGTYAIHVDGTDTGRVIEVTGSGSTVSPESAQDLLAYIPEDSLPLSDFEPDDEGMPLSEEEAGSEATLSLLEQGSGEESSQGVAETEATQPNTEESSLITTLDVTAVTLNFYTVSYAATTDGAVGLTAWINAFDGKAPVASEAVVLAGTSIVFTAAGAGATNFNYLWSDDSTEQTLTITNIQAPVTVSCVVSGSEPQVAHAVAVKVNLDDNAWSGKVVELFDAGSQVALLTEQSDGTYTGEVLPGTYDVRLDGVSTGRDITVIDPSDDEAIFVSSLAPHNTGVNEVTLLHYSVTFSATPAGAATGASALATNSLESGGVVLSDSSITLTAAGAGAGSYTYLWSDGSTHENLTILNIQAPINISCVVNGFSAPAPVKPRLPNTAGQPHHDGFPLYFLALSATTLGITAAKKKKQ